MKLDILAFGVHPDDVELGCAGTLLAAIAEGKQVGIVDLTQGELGTRGTADTRLIEAADAAKLLGVPVRKNLKMADGFFKNDEAHQLALIRILRQYRPEIILCNAPDDRHPDHGRSAQLQSDAAFLSGLRKIETLYNGEAQSAWRPKYVIHYIQNSMLEPTFIFDISNYLERKMEAILCYKTQFNSPDTNSPQTYISSPDFVENIRGRAREFGKRVGVAYGEAFITKKNIAIRSFDALVQEVT